MDESSARDRLLLCLRVAVVAQCVGYLSQSLLGETSIFEFFFLTADLSESVSLAISRGGSLMILAASLGLFFRQSRMLGYLVAGWFAFSAFADMNLSGEPFSHLALLSHSVRYLSPIALVWLPAEVDGTGSVSRLVPWAGHLLRFSVAVTFLAHGWEALQAHPRFIDYLLLSSRRLLDAPLAESSAVTILTVIGIVDLVVGLLVAAGIDAAFLLLYMAAWGTIAAFSRMVHGGLWAFPATLVRAANGLAPLALYFFARGFRTGHDHDAAAND